MFYLELSRTLRNASSVVLISFQGNLQIVNSIDCGEKVVSIIYTDDGLYLGKPISFPIVKRSRITNCFSINLIKTQQCLFS